MWWIIIISFIVGTVAGRLTHFIKKKDKYLRRGIYNKTFAYSSASVSGENIDAQFEISEIERTESKSKVKVNNITLNGTKHYDSIDKMKKLVDGSWVESNEIEWIIPSVEDNRSNKIKQILNL